MRFCVEIKKDKYEFKPNEQHTNSSWKSFAIESGEKISEFYEKSDPVYIFQLTLTCVVALSSVDEFHSEYNLVHCSEDIEKNNVYFTRRGNNINLQQFIKNVLRNRRGPIPSFSVFSSIVRNSSKKKNQKRNEGIRSFFIHAIRIAVASIVCNR